MSALQTPSAEDHPLLDVNKRELVADGLFRSIIGEQAPEVIVVLITYYSQWFKQWRPQWPKEEDYKFLSGRVAANSSDSISSYHWRNTGGTIISLNALPTMMENDEYSYGDKIKWTVSFHRQPRQFSTEQSFGVTETPQSARYIKAKSIMIDGEGGYIHGMRYNEIWREMHGDDNEEDESDENEENIKEGEHWYRPKELENPSQYHNYKRPPAVVETFHFEWNIEHSMMTIFDPEMQKMGKGDKPYTWWLRDCEKLHLQVRCDGYQSKLEYKFVDTNTE